MVRRAKWPRDEDRLQGWALGKAGLRQAGATSQGGRVQEKGTARGACHAQVKHQPPPTSSRTGSMLPLKQTCNPLGLAGKTTLKLVTMQLLHLTNGKKQGVFFSL